MLAGLEPLGQQFFGVVGVVNVLPALVGAGMGRDERFVVIDA